MCVGLRVPLELRENGNRCQEECQGDSINEAIDARKNVKVIPSMRQKVGLDRVLPPREECNWIVIFEFRTSDSQHSENNNENNNFNNPGRRTRMEVVILICIQIAYLTFSCFQKKLPRAVLEYILLFIV